jgi:predicted phage terminase large subunit-like protein
LETVRIRLHPAQAAFRASDALYRGFVGGIGSGKSWVGAYDLLMRASQQPGLYAVYAATYPMLRDATYRSFAEIGGDLRLVAEHHKGEFRSVLSNGAEVLFRSLDDPEKARGPNLSGAWFDEASLVDRAAFDVIIGRLRQEGRQGWLSATFTPKGRQHWTYDVFGKATQNTALFRASTRDNPFLPSTFYHAVRSQYTGQLAEQELEGAFIDISGGIAKRAWFPIVDAAPADAKRVRYWDFAATGKENKGDADYTVGTRIAAADGLWYVESVVRGRFGPGEVERVVRQTADTDGRDVAIRMEQEPGSSGKLFTAAMVRALAGWDVKAVPSSGDKVQRAMPFIAQAEAGNVRLVSGPWIEAWLDELTMVPEAVHDDQWDSAAGAFAALTNRPSAASLYAFV